jgi:hypothetical protein
MKARAVRHPLEACENCKGAAKRHGTASFKLFSGDLGRRLQLSYREC